MTTTTELHAASLQPGGPIPAMKARSVTATVNAAIAPQWDSCPKTSSVAFPKLAMSSGPRITRRIAAKMSSRALRVQRRSDDPPPLGIKNDEADRGQQVGERKRLEPGRRGDHTGSDREGDHRLNCASRAVRPPQVAENTDESEGEQSPDRHLVDPMRGSIFEVGEPSDHEQVHRAEHIQERGVEDRRANMDATTPRRLR